MLSVTRLEKQRYGSSPDRSNSFDDSLEIKTIKPILKLSFPNCKIIEKPYGDYGIDVVVRSGDKDILWVELERSFGWVNEFPYGSVSFLERKFRFVEEAEQVGADFMMCWFNKDHTQFVEASGDVIRQYEPFDKTLRSGNKDRVRHISKSKCHFHKV